MKMKTCLGAAAALFVLVSCQGATSSASNSTSTGINRYPFKSMAIEFSIQSSGMGSTTTGKRMLYVDDYGAKESDMTQQTTKASFMGQTTEDKSHTLAIIDGENFYSIDLIDNTGVKGDLSEMKQMGQVMGAAMMDKGFDYKSVKEFVEKNGGVWHGQESFLGKTCDVFEWMGTKQWMYKGVVVKMEGDMMGVKSVIAAVKIDENASIPADVFKVPSGIAFTANPMMGEMGALETMADNDDDSEGDMPSTVTLPYPKFKSALAALSSLGYTLLVCDDSDRIYTSVFSKGETDAMGVAAMPIACLDSKAMKEAVLVELKRYKLNGRTAAVFTLTEPDNTPMKGLGVEYPEYGMCLWVTLPQSASVEQLEAIANKVKF